MERASSPDGDARPRDPEPEAAISPGPWPEPSEATPAARPPRIRLVVGLGNPGERYARTRHNAGFLVLDQLRAEGDPSWRRCHDREETSVTLGGGDLLLVRPITFMNRSGKAVATVLAERGLSPAEMLVVVDDTSLPEGRVRIRESGGPGGHNGLRSITELIGTEDFPRVRLGVGAAPPEVDLADYVLATLDAAEWEALRATVEVAVEAVRLACAEGVRAAMNRFNPAPRPAAPAPGG